MFMLHCAVMSMLTHFAASAVASGHGRHHAIMSGAGRGLLVGHRPDRVEALRTDPAEPEPPRAES